MSILVATQGLRAKEFTSTVIAREHPGVCWARNMANCFTTSLTTTICVDIIWVEMKCQVNRNQTLIGITFYRVGEAGGTTTVLRGIRGCFRVTIFLWLPCLMEQAIMDGALLLIAANEKAALKPQTSEHLAAVENYGAFNIYNPPE
ncbi:hypothetical protein SDJN02_04579, partial [Cucurbita argyrosperma subsp. argyrosperma]